MTLNSFTALMTMHWLGYDRDTLHLQNTEGMLTHVFDFVFTLLLDMFNHKPCHVSIASGWCLL